MRVSFPESEGEAGPPVPLASSAALASSGTAAGSSKGKARRSSKRAKTAAVTSSTPNATCRVVDIHCHTMIICMRSPYFASALAGGWKEGETKVVEIAMADGAAVRDLKLLLKLSYGGKYDTLFFVPRHV